MQQVVLSLVLVDHTTCLRFDRDASFPFDIKLVQNLLVSTLFNRAGQLQQPIAERALSMIHMSDDAEIPKPLNRNVQDPLLES